MSFLSAPSNSGDRPERQGRPRVGSLRCDVDTPRHAGLERLPSGEAAEMAAMEDRLRALEYQHESQEVEFTSLLQQLDSKQNRIDAQWLRRTQEQERELERLRQLCEEVRRDAATETEAARRCAERRRCAPWPPSGFQIVAVPTRGADGTISGSVACLIPDESTLKPKEPIRAKRTESASPPRFPGLMPNPAQHSHRATVPRRPPPPLRELLQSSRPPPAVPPGGPRLPAPPLSPEVVLSEATAPGSAVELPPLSAPPSSKPASEEAGSDEDADEALFQALRYSLQQQQQHLIGLARRCRFISHHTLLEPVPEPGAPDREPEAPPDLPQIMTSPPQEPVQLSPAPPQVPWRPSRRVRRAGLRKGWQPRRAGRKSGLREAAQLASSLGVEQSKAEERDRSLSNLIEQSAQLRSTLEHFA